MSLVCLAPDSYFSWALAVAANDLDLIGMDRLAGVIHLEGDILDQESPDLVAKAVGIEMTL
jgi:hypothetical protein